MSESIEELDAQRQDVMNNLKDFQKRNSQRAAELKLKLSKIDEDWQKEIIELDKRIAEEQKKAMEEIELSIAKTEEEAEKRRARGRMIGIICGSVIIGLLLAKKKFRQ